MAKEKPRAHELDRVWSALEGYPRLGSIAVAHRGAHWTGPATDRRDALDSPGATRTYDTGIRHASDQFEPYFAAGGIEDLSDASGVNREGDGLPWHLPKAIVRWNWRDGGAWPITAVPDWGGVVAFDDFLGVWPTGGISAGVVAAILNGPVANAYPGALGRPPGDGAAALEDVPIPPLSEALVSHLHDLTSTYRTERVRLPMMLTQEGMDRCLELPGAIDDLVLKAYDLPPVVEAELLDHFAGESRPGFERVMQIAREAPSPLPHRVPEPLMSPEEMAAWQRSIEEADAAMEAGQRKFEEQLRVDRPELFDASGVLRTDVLQRAMVQRVAQQQKKAREELGALIRRRDRRSVDAPKALLACSRPGELSLRVLRSPGAHPGNGVRGRA